MKRIVCFLTVLTMVLMIAFSPVGGVGLKVQASEANSENGLNEDEFIHSFYLDGLMQQSDMSMESKRYDYKCYDINSIDYQRVFRVFLDIYNSAMPFGRNMRAWSLQEYSDFSDTLVPVEARETEIDGDEIVSSGWKDDYSVYRVDDESSAYISIHNSYYYDLTVAGTVEEGADDCGISYTIQFTDETPSEISPYANKTVADILTQMGQTDLIDFMTTPYSVGDGKGVVSKFYCCNEKDPDRGLRIDFSPTWEDDDGYKGISWITAQYSDPKNDYAYNMRMDFHGNTGKIKSVTFGGTNVNVMYRLYNPNSGEHLYTANVNEKNMLVNLGWADEGIGWIAPKKSDKAVYRLYNPNSGEHHYTTSKNERDMLKSIGWNDEGVGWYSDSEDVIPLYRLYNPNAVGQYEPGAHHYTISANERDVLVTYGWNDEGIGWYGF